MILVYLEHEFQHSPDRIFCLESAKIHAQVKQESFTWRLEFQHPIMLVSSNDRQQYWILFGIVDSVTLFFMFPPNNSGKG